MRALLHFRVRRGSQTPLVSAVEQPHRLLDLKELDSSEGIPMVLLTVIVAETTNEDWGFWQLPLTSLLRRFDSLLNQDAVLQSRLIFDRVKLTEMGPLFFEHDLLGYLGKRRIALQVVEAELNPDEWA